MRGVQLQSDIGMLPDNEISYTPVVRGIAETNATVEVSQNGFVIYSTNVPPGAFEITDIYPSGSNGDLEVKIIEADGRQRSFKQSYSYLPVMTRKGTCAMAWPPVNTIMTASRRSTCSRDRLCMACPTGLPALAACWLPRSTMPPTWASASTRPWAVFLRT